MQEETVEDIRHQKNGSFFLRLFPFKGELNLKAGPELLIISVSKIIFHWNGASYIKLIRTDQYIKLVLQVGN